MKFLSYLCKYLCERTDQNLIYDYFSGPDWQETRDPSETNGTSNGSTDPSSSTSKNHPKPMTSEQLSNFELAKLLVESTDGSWVDINSAIMYFTEKERRKKRPTPWKVDLEIGPDIIVNITGYIKVRHEAPKSWKSCTADDPDCEEISPEVTYVRNNEDQEAIEREDCVEAYKYGSELITISGTILLVLSFFVHEFDSIHARFDFAPIYIATMIES